MPRINKKREQTITWLSSLRDSGLLHCPVHRMNLDNWYKCYQDEFSNTNGEHYIQDKGYFQFQMSQITTKHLMEGVKKVVRKRPTYTVLYELKADIQELSKVTRATLKDHARELPANDKSYHGHKTHTQFNTESSTLGYSTRSAAAMRADAYITQSKSLNFESVPRFLPSGREEIQLHGAKRLTKRMKWAMVAQCADFGVSDIKSTKRRYEIFEAVVLTHSYNCGYKNPAVNLYYFELIWKQFKDALIATPGKICSVYKSRAGKGRVSYITQITTKFPTLLHDIYRYSIKVLGSTANCRSIWTMMNARSNYLYPNCPIHSNLGLTRYHFWHFFTKFGGKLKRPTTKPRLTPEQRKQRVRWVRKW